LTVPYCSQSLQRLDQPQLHRNYSFPPDIHAVNPVNEPSGATELTSESQTDISTPSLVARLQQAHGLTKKKIYGAKPTRQPFFREDRVREKYRRAPTPLTIPSSLADKSPRPLVHRDRSRSRSQLDHKLVAERASEVSPTDPHSRSLHHSSWSRRGSRVSSPETDTSLSSPASVSTYSTVSPILPVLPDLEQSSLAMSPPVTPSLDECFVSGPKLESAGMSSIGHLDPAVHLTEPSWLHGRYSSSLPPFLLPSQMPGDNLARDDGSITPKSHALPRRHTVSLASYRTPTHLQPSVRVNPPIGGGGTINAANEHKSFSLSQAASAAMDDGDRPFIFHDELEETVPPMEGPLQRPSNYLYPAPSNEFPAFATLPFRHNSYSSTVPPLMQPFASAAPAVVAYRQSPYPQPTQVVPGRPPMSPVTHKGMSGNYNVGSSSLTGWAG
jgi:hypothetical protein